MGCGKMLMTASAAERILDFDTRFVMDGDVLVTVRDPLGEAEEITVTESKEITPELLWKQFTQYRFFLLRPGR